MIFGYALEPELVATWGNKADYRYFYDKFGLGQQRLMVEFPKLKNWRRQVLKSAIGVGDEELQKITAMIGILTDRVIACCPTAEYDGTQSWLENAEIEHSNCPFQAILAHSNPRRLPCIITPDSVGTPGDSRWDVADHLPPDRTIISMQQHLQALLSNCTEIVFIDPHFGPENPRHRRPLQAYLRGLFINRRAPLSRVVVKTGTKAAFPFFESTCTQEMPRIIPNGLEVVFYRLKQRDNSEKLHNRYILTDIGGVNFGVGLDEGSENETEDVGLLTRKQYELRWEQYAGSRLVFDVVDRPIVVRGV
ncbi:MAG: hypothetical protein AB9919_11945 [Geobacteraceae bacterium]